MYKSMFILVISIMAVMAAVDQQVNQALKAINSKKAKTEMLSKQLQNKQRQLRQCKRNIQYSQTVCRKIKDQKIQLEAKLFIVNEKNRQLQKQLTRGQDQNNKIHIGKIAELQNKLKSATERINYELQQKFNLQKKIDVIKQDIKWFEDKIKKLQEQAITKAEAYYKQLKQTKQSFQNRIKNQLTKKCDVISQQLSNKQKLCKNQALSLKDKIYNLQKAAQNKAKQFADNIGNIRNRIKNYLTGKGPYNKQDQAQFAEFRNKINQLEQKISTRQNDWDRMMKQKEDVDFQQQYCRARLADYEDEVKELEKYANQKGKAYYVDQIKKIHKKQIVPSCPKDEDLIAPYRQKVIDLEQKLRIQLDQNQKLRQQLKKSSQQGGPISPKISALQEQNKKLKEQNEEYRKLFASIYSLKDR